MVHLHPDYKEFIESLNAHDVEYMVVGAIALGWHGAPRFTGDLDVLIRPSSQNGERIVRALRSFGFAFEELGVEDFQDPGQVIQLGVAPLRIDLLTGIDGVSWDDAVRGMIRTTVDNVPVTIIGRDELIANKRATGRTQDLADIERLESDNSN